MIDNRIDVSVLRDLLRCDPDNGVLYWLARGPRHFPGVDRSASWNARFAGTEALHSITENGYRRGTLLGKRHRAHIVIWAMATGEWPDGFIDHINGIRSDNRMSNLRIASRSQNARNTKSRDGSASSYLGVSRRSSGRYWSASIFVDGRSLYLGSFQNEEDAARAYDSAAIKNAGDFARLNFPDAILAAAQKEAEA